MPSRIPKQRVIKHWCFQVTCKCKVWARQLRGEDLAVTEIGGDRCLMESRITDLARFTCNHQLLRFPLSSPLLSLLQGHGLGEEGMKIFRFLPKFLELPLILWPIPSWNHNQGTEKWEWIYIYLIIGVLHWTPRIYTVFPKQSSAGCVWLTGATPQRKNTMINRASWPMHSVPSCPEPQGRHQHNFPPIIHM